MFQGTLLESSSGTQKRNHWPMATAFTVQMLVAGLLVIVPLLSTGIIPLSARVPDYTPIYTPVASTPPTNSGGSSTAVSVPHSTVVPVYTANSVINPYGKRTSGPGDPNPQVPNLPCTGNCTGPAIAPGGGHVLPLPEPEEEKQRIKISHLSEGMLVHKVIPVYPRFVLATGVQGDVKLHAIIARDGSIQSLNVISGPPLLTNAALEAVSQWKYRPYLLNDDPVEVETYITVSFTRQR